MFVSKLLTTASAILALVTTSLAVEPEAVYHGDYKKGSPIRLKIANGGAGQSGLVKEISNAFINHYTTKHKVAPFQVAWYKSDTTYTIKYLESGTVDVGITYSEIAETLAINQRIANESYYIFRDHFYLVGPLSNPAKVDNNSDILTIFSKLYTAAETGNTTVPTRFLARYDKSATSIKDSELWLKVGQVPWAYAYSTWYHQYPAFPLQALRAAYLLDEYTITDRGTFLTTSIDIRNKLKVIKEGEDDDPCDLLLNPAHLLTGMKADNPEMGNAFAKYLVSAEGQAVITNFKNDNQTLYTGAPKPGDRKCGEAEAHKLIVQG